MISFIHIRDDTNAGDMASEPSQYFYSTDFPDKNVLNFSCSVPDGVTVYGGGTMVNWLNAKPALPDGPRIIWGAGSSRHGETEPWPDPEGFALIGTREWSPEREAAGLYAPCASCMSPLFDKEYSVSREAVAFVNANDSIRGRYPAAYRLDMPTMNNSGGMAEILEFLGSAEVVHTNSYHGCWFALLLGRKVVCYPYSSKFYGFKYPINYAGCSEDISALSSGGAFSEALDESRAYTTMFFDRVMEILDGH